MLCKKKVFHLNQPTAKQPAIFKGLVFAALSGVFLSLVAVLVKQMKNLHPGQLAFYRFIATTVLSLPEVAKTGHNPLGPKGSRLVLSIMGLFGGFNMCMSFSAFRYLGLGEASVIIFSSPVFVIIFARIIFKEPCNIFQTISAVLTLVGLIFTTKLSSRLFQMNITYSKDKIYGCGAALTSAFCAVVVQLIARKLTNVHHSVKTFNYSWIGGCLIAILTSIFGNFRWQQCGIQSASILLLALLSFGGLSLMLMAFQCEFAGSVATMRASSDIIMGFVWQILIFHDTPDLHGIIGAVLIIVSIVLIGLNKWLKCCKSN